MVSHEAFTQLTFKASTLAGMLFFPRTGFTDTDNLSSSNDQRRLRLPHTLILSLVVGLLLSACVAQAEPTTFARQEGTLWSPYVEWRLIYTDYSGNPFDVIAWAEFTHEPSGEQLRVPMFYAGGGQFRFRFSGTRTGLWYFVTESDVAALRGHQGEVMIDENPDPEARGFLTTFENRFALQSGEDTLEATLYNIYFNHDFAERLHHYPAEEGAFRETFAEILDETEAHGMNALLILIGNNWLSYGNMSHNEHSSSEPSLQTFEKLEWAIGMAQDRGLHLHFWAWGDEERRITPIGLDGGINGRVDQRIQRYIAARLGALPGWTMSYGFDLEEWVTPDEVRVWADTIHEHTPYPRLLTAREWGTWQNQDFMLGDDKLDIYSNDFRPTGENDPYEFYAVARDVKSTGIPTLFERRFLHTRDGVWDLETTRRAMWQFAMAGGSGSIWGVLWEGGEPYPESAQLRHHATFWRDRFTLELAPNDVISQALTLATDDLSRIILYQQDTDIITLDVSGMPVAQQVIAFDTRSADYTELALGTLEPGEHSLQLPYPSDWAIAIGN
jgi:hypothetical protein